jgi:hypothetical protein
LLAARIYGSKQLRIRIAFASDRSIAYLTPSKENSSVVAATEPSKSSVHTVEYRFATGTFTSTARHSAVFPRKS